MSILPFGSNQRNTQTCEMVRVGIRTQEGPDQVMELFVVPLILAQLKLPDSSDGASTKEC